MDDESHNRSKSFGALRRVAGRVTGGLSRDAREKLSALKAQLQLSYCDESYNEADVEALIAALSQVPGVFDERAYYEDHLIVLAVSNYHVTALRALLEDSSRLPLPVAKPSRTLLESGHAKKEDQYPIIIALYHAALNVMAKSVCLDERADQLARVREMAVLLLNPRLPYQDTLKASCYIDKSGESFLVKLIEIINTPIKEQQENGVLVNAGSKPLSIDTQHARVRIRPVTPEQLHPLSLQRLFMLQDVHGLLTLHALFGTGTQHLHQAFRNRVVELTRSSKAVDGQVVTNHGIIKGTWWDYLVEVVAEGQLSQLNYEFLATLHAVGYRLSHTDRDRILFFIADCKTTESAKDGSFQFNEVKGQRKACLLYIAALDGALRGNDKTEFESLAFSAQESELLKKLCGIAWEFRRQAGEVYQPLLTLILALLNTMPDPKEIKAVLAHVKGSDRDYYDMIKQSIDNNSIKTLARTLTVLRRIRSTVRSKAPPVEDGEKLHRGTVPEGEGLEETAVYANVNPPPVAMAESTYEDMTPEIATMTPVELEGAVKGILASHNIDQLVAWIGEGLDFSKFQLLLSTHFSENPEDYDKFEDKLRQQARHHQGIKAVLELVERPVYEDMSQGERRPRSPAPLPEGVKPAMPSIYHTVVFTSEEHPYENPDAPAQVVITDGRFGTFERRGATGTVAQPETDLMAGVYGDRADFQGHGHQPPNVYGDEGCRTFFTADGQALSETAYVNASAALDKTVRTRLAPPPSSEHDHRPKPLPKLKGTRRATSAVRGGLLHHGQGEEVVNASSREGDKPALTSSSSSA